MSSHLLPMKTGNEQFPVQYRNVVSTTKIASTITVEHNSMLYILKQNTYTVSDSQYDGKAYIYTINLFTGSMTKYAELDYVTDLDSVGAISDMLVDDNFIYLTRITNSGNKPVIIIFKQRNPNAQNASISLEKIGSYEYYTNTLNGYGKMQWLDDNHICIGCNYGVMFFDTNLRVFETVPTNSQYTFRSFAVGNDLIIYTNESTSASTIIIYDRTTREYTTQSLPTTDPACIAYSNGKFYICNQNYLYIFDEATQTVVKTVNIPWLKPKDVQAFNDVVYVISESSARSYIYDTKYNASYSFILPWTIGKMKWDDITRGCVSEGFWFVMNETLMIADYSGYSKYNFGYKYESLTVMFNRDTMAQCVYDPRFVSFDETTMSVHDGDIEYPLTPTSTPSIKSVHVSKEDYHILNHVQFKSE